MSRSGKLWNDWLRWWFAPTGRYQIGLFRIALLLYFVNLYSVFYSDFARFNRRPLTLLEPCLMMRLLPIPYPWPDGLGEAMFAIGWTTLFTSLVGLCTRPSLIVFTLVTYHLHSIRYSFGYFGHAHLLPALALGVLALAPDIASYSLDRVIRAWRRREPIWPGLRGGPAAPWAARVVLIQIALLYLAAGVAKMRYAGPRWMDGQTMQFYLAGESRAGRQHFGAKENPTPEDLWRDGYGIESHLYLSGPPPELGQAVARSRVACQVMSVATIVLEFGFVMVLFVPRLLFPTLVALVLMHEGILYTLDANFRGHYAVFLLFADWRVVGRCLRSFLAE